MFALKKYNNDVDSAGLCYYSTGGQQAKAAFDDVQARKDDLMEKYSQEYEHSEEYSEVY